MSRRFNDHVWIVGDGPRGYRGVRGDRCKRCGCFRVKRNGVRFYWWSGDLTHPRSSPACDPKKLQGVLDLEGQTPARSKGQATDPQRVPTISGQEGRHDG